MILFLIISAGVMLSLKVPQLCVSLCSNLGGNIFKSKTFITQIIYKSTLNESKIDLIACQIITKLTTNIICIFCLLIQQLLIVMQENDMFKKSAEYEDLFKITTFCIAQCKTINKSNLTVHESQCLENCGYNRGFLGAHFKQILDGTLSNSMDGFQFGQE